MGRERCIESAENESEPFRMFGLNSLSKVSEKQKFRKNRCLRKEHPVWILARSANMFFPVLKNNSRPLCLKLRIIIQYNNRATVTRNVTILNSRIKYFA
uniref:Uncharacterized protein n=1 Tax=Candidatus Kentrum sp. LPFa TaxID=2126335 RepID=A0A450WNI9_9GAMM|nr:MAG: hypothetical protein BECKLPF1236A_GA0070988_102018 [Candidatus Kentron sp. LPFa]VFK33090.1 MAG: hypothetical protein BECKLPF1236C_GA0070990_101918 [Candidatus Kentron sp. LPFa]